VSPTATRAAPAAARIAVGRPGAAAAVSASTLLAGLTGALAVRVGIAGPGGVRSVPAGLAFAGLLLALTMAARTSPPAAATAPLGPWARQLVGGLGAAAVLCAVPLTVHLRTPGAALSLHAFPLWAAVVTAVAVAEEALIRGALWGAYERRRGTAVALVGTTVVFGLLHVPLYGWQALPLDLAVGLLLGGLRMTTGGWGGPAVAHTLADVAGWWLR
jgi:membrane protease YdiL (CAAX protease family)